ncbi:larval cuticle protein 1-like [Oratosquilla oratoria]|uniref:larval cuticle protein 1-like n=1 Tax=Oratosquilla oratoria TaxID=337810 RepID=UPI003F762601
MIRQIALFCACVIGVSAHIRRPSFDPSRGKPTPTPILSETRFEPDPDGSYSFSYIAGDGTYRSEVGKPDHSVYLPEGQGKKRPLLVRGNYGYTSPEGIGVKVNYHAGVQGFRPSIEIENQD